LGICNNFNYLESALNPAVLTWQP